MPGISRAFPRGMCVRDAFIAQKGNELPVERVRGIGDDVMTMYSHNNCIYAPGRVLVFSYTLRYTACTYWSKEHDITLVAGAGWTRS